MLSIPVLVINTIKACFLSTDGEVEIYDKNQVSPKVKDAGVLVCHAPYTAKQAELKFRPAFDLLELYAFVYPTRFAVPTINGLAKALEMDTAHDLEDQAMLAIEIATNLINAIPAEDKYLDIVQFMNRQGQGWAWAPVILQAKGKEPTAISMRDMKLWQNRAEWEDIPKTEPASQQGISQEDAAAHLKNWLTARQTKSEDRPEQINYTQKITKAFQPSQLSDDGPAVLLAEAGTGIGKTLGYLNPSWMWAEKNSDTVWLSTYTKNLQRQLAKELKGLIPEKIDEEQTLVIRKGRENYVCLLNVEEHLKASQLAQNPYMRISAGLMLRWVMESEDGDFTGDGFHGWLLTLLGYQDTLGLSDRRGECLYGACDHYKKCFIEHATRKAKKAKLVVSNHALTMIQAALAKPEMDLPTRYVFDEGHHLFDAADSAYAANLSFMEVLDLKRWILGAETGRKTRAKGLRRRMEGLYEGHERAEKIIESISRRAHQLPMHESIGAFRKGQSADSSNPGEQFFMAVKEQIKVRVKQSQGSFSLYGLECDIRPVEPLVLGHADSFQKVLIDLRKPLLQLIDYLKNKAADEAQEEVPDTTLINRIESLMSSIQRRCDSMLTPWITMLGQLETVFSDDFIDWFGLDRAEGQDMDVGMYRRWVDPMIPFASTMSIHAKGMAVTSATLRDSVQDEAGWETAYEQTGARHFKNTPESFYAPSPFDYKSNAKDFIVNDVRKDQLDLVATAYASLMKASGGGALGIFTAINRLKTMHPQIMEELGKQDIQLLAQHVDDMDVGTLIDMFRDQDKSCLIGTDAVRDGVDVPGDALRMLIFERVPWPRPTILHKARKEHFGGRAYDERMTRLKLKQAFGRLIRQKTDRGVFVMLDPMFPSRLHDAFPPDVEIIKAPLAEIITQVSDFFADGNALSL